MSTLAESRDRSKLIYEFYLKKLEEPERQKHSIEFEMTVNECDLAYSAQLIERLDAKVRTLKIAINSRNLELADLKRRLEICQNSCDDGASKVEESRIIRALELGEVKVVSKPYEPQLPVEPRRRLIVTAGGCGGLMLGILLAFVAELRQKKDDADESG